ncbi:MAG: fibrobacter succinogenes major paralogous domain-containing protein [Fibrobacteres bacterium]|nr:fibrobacter succinogenes major paralogous domain-containing protein [Fibrobacterota bacterium]
MIRKLILPCAALVLAAPLAHAKTTPVKESVPVSKGQMTDSRDGTIYNTVTIGSQRWMAENLDYRTGASWCYGKKAANCAKYGRLYDWETARSACPRGWHLPSDREWTQLEDLIGQGANAKVGEKLKAASPNWDGTDAYFFSVLPAGYRSDDESSVGIRNVVYFWSATADRDGDAWSRQFYLTDASVYSGSVNETRGLSVRCLEN